MSLAMGFYKTKEKATKSIDVNFRAVLYAYSTRAVHFPSDPGPLTTYGWHDGSTSQQ